MQYHLQYDNYLRITSLLHEYLLHKSQPKCICKLTIMLTQSVYRNPDRQTYRINTCQSTLNQCHGCTPYKIHDTHADSQGKNKPS